MVSDNYRHIGVIVVDVQGDFTEVKEGSLAVGGTDAAFIETLANVTEQMKDAGFTVFATQDWHPADHVSFFSNHVGKNPFDVIEVDGRTQVLWPPHCVQGTENAGILIDTELFERVVQKGQDKLFDSYSGFQDDGGKKTEMNGLLKQYGIQKVLVYGIATDYCVKATAIDALQSGYEVVVFKDLCRGVDPETSAAALVEMDEAGVLVTDLPDIDMIRSS